MSALLLLAAMAAAPLPVRIDAIAERSGLAGEILIAKGDTILLDQGYGPVAPAGGPRHVAGKRWRLASITKQVTAVRVMRRVARGDLALDAPLGGPTYLAGVTMRMLLQHHSGLADPDDTVAEADGVPAFYKAKAPGLPYCSSKAGTPNAPFHYNNCDYIVAAGFIEAGQGDTGEIDNVLLSPGLRTASRRDKIVPGYSKARPEAAISIASFGAAGNLTGSARDVLAFDRALMTGKLLSPAALAELWKPEGGGSYQGLGQWVFPGTLKGCTAPKRIVQRDGEIGGVQTRNYIFPDDDLVVVVFTNRSSDDFAIGEVWQGKGFAYDLLSAVACA